MKVYVVTHKPCSNPLPPDYEYFQVNAAKNEVFCPLNDAIGSDNISEKNENFCELTAAYWIWKNDKTNDIVGLAHYRRFLTTNRFSSNVKYYITSAKAEKLLKKYDFITTKEYKTVKTIREHFLEEVLREKDLDTLREVIKDVCPQYLGSYDAIMSGRKTHLLNMFICRKKEWDDYYSWLFSVLDELEKRVDLTGYNSVQRRFYGYLGEFLFAVYLRQNNCRVKCYPVHIVGENKFSTAVRKVLRLIGIKT